MCGNPRRYFGEVSLQERRRSFDDREVASKVSYLLRR
jgi:hypothetical protein